MKRAELFHPRVFEDKEWAKGYYKRNAANIRRMGKRYIELLQKSGFTRGKVLDAGCGFGTIPVEIAKAFPDVEITAIDLGKPLLELGKSQAGEASVDDRIAFRIGDVEKLDFPDDSFDLVINTFMLHIVENPVTMLNELERVSMADGRIMITDLRRIWLGLFMKKFKTAFAMEEAMEIIGQSKLRKGRPAKGFFWLDYFVGV